MKEQTLSMIKPDAVKAKAIGKIIARFEKENFEILAMKKLHLTEKEARAFYEIHKGKPFFEDLVHFIVSGPVVVMVLQKENAIEANRKLMGATDPKKAEVNTLRKEFGTSIDHNAIHGSDAIETAKKEIAFFFSEREWL